MRRAYTKVSGAILSVIVVTAAIWGLFVPPHVGHYFTTMIGCLCMPPRWHPANSEALLAANGWFRFDAGRFNLYAPPNTVVRPRNTWDGEIATPKFTLVYEFGPAGFAVASRNVVDEPMRIEGREAILRRATGPDGSYLAGLFVLRAIVLNGRPVPLLIQGTFRTRGDRAVADAIMATVSFRPFLPPDWERQPPTVKVEPPTFDIAPDPS